MIVDKFHPRKTLSIIIYQISIISAVVFKLISMPKNWTEAKLNNFITSGIEESLTLEYKSAEALDRSEYKKKEITKDVSAMANSAGGILIYGIAEFSAENKRHLPEKITPVNRNEFPREWVEQIINAIRPRIDGIVIHSVNLSSGENAHGLHHRNSAEQHGASGFGSPLLQTL